MKRTDRLEFDMAPKYMSPGDVSEGYDENKPYSELEVRSNGDDFVHESFTMARPPRVAKFKVGEYTAKIVGMKQTKEPNFDFPEQIDDKVVFNFEVEGEGGKTIQRKVNLKFHSKSRLGQILMAATGKIPTKIESDELIGKKVLITITHNKTDSGDVYDNVTSFASVD